MSVSHCWCFNFDCSFKETPQLVSGPTHSTCHLHGATNRVTYFLSLRHRALEAHLVPQASPRPLFTWAAFKQVHPGLACVQLIFRIWMEKLIYPYSILLIFIQNSRSLEKNACHICYHSDSLSFVIWFASLLCGSLITLAKSWIGYSEEQNPSSLMSNTLLMWLLVCF